MRVLDAALGSPWAIEQYALEQILAIAAREHDVTPEALEKYRLEQMTKGERLQKRGPVAVMSVSGPLFRRANLFTEMSGATSYEMLRRDLQVAIDDRDVASVLLNVDSPGGHANGVGELAKAISESPKPVVAYVGATSASAAYWLTSAASEIVVDDSAALGSIGVIVGLSDSSGADAARGVRRFEFVSSQSPRKNANPESESGAAHYQEIADAMAAVFIDSVAEYRGVSRETVLSDFGKGGTLIGSAAVAAGMADRVGTFEDTLSGLVKAAPPKRSRMKPSPRLAASGPPAAEPAASTSQQETPMADPTPAGPSSADIDAARREAAAQAIAADRQRRTAIMALEEAKGREALAEHLHATTDMSVDQVKATLLTAPTASAPEPQNPPPDDPAAEQRSYDAIRAVAGAGLGGAPRTQREPRVNLAADMKRRVGGKS